MTTLLRIQLFLPLNCSPPIKTKISHQHPTKQMQTHALTYTNSYYALSRKTKLTTKTMNFCLVFPINPPPHKADIHTRSYAVKNHSQ